MLGDYELVRRLGVGGMGVVFEARQRNVLGRRVALKVLRTTLETEELSLRFQREVAAVAALDHPGIVPIVDARVDAGTPYYVMKLVEGVSAAGIIRELKGSSRPPVETATVRRFIERFIADSSDGRERPSSHEGVESSWEEHYLRWVARIGLQLAEALQYFRQPQDVLVAVPGWSTGGPDLGARAPVSDVHAEESVPLLELVDEGPVVREACDRGCISRDRSTIVRVDGEVPWIECERAPPAGPSVISSLLPS